ncbi:hypothetical protein E2C01_064892 [Portunus trituberculatus]|uniref:Uncharacterized protein n=1 Tax=Portunus trituberculatus TaxID=210409 RepID=A0A5B7HN61_PORTR|nr:hypothetical protein [Portunus trituberculatus]
MQMLMLIAAKLLIANPKDLFYTKVLNDSTAERLATNYTGTVNSDALFIPPTEENLGLTKPLVVTQKRAQVEW